MEIPKDMNSELMEEPDDEQPEQAEPQSQNPITQIQCGACKSFKMHFLGHIAAQELCLLCENCGAMSSVFLANQTKTKEKAQPRSYVG